MAMAHSATGAKLVIGMAVRSRSKAAADAWRNCG